MNIVINAVLAYDKPRGVGRYINNLLPALAEIDKENEYYVYFGAWMKEYEFLKISQKNFHFIELDIKNSQISRNFYLAFILPIAFKKYHPDVFFLIDTQAIAIKTCPIISTIHDLAEYIVPEKYSKRQATIRRWIVKHQIHVSNQILTVSNYSKKAICNRFSIREEKVHVTYNSVALSQEVSEACEPDNYFLFVSETERAKNLMELIEAYDMLDSTKKDKFSIKVVGKKGNDHENIMRVIKEKGIESNVTFYGYISDEELNVLYRKAYAFVFPSLFEGFGLPVLEAMAKGTPVLCSNIASLSEVGGNAVLTFSPYNVEELAKQLEVIVSNSELRRSMIQSGLNRAKSFTAEHMAEQTLNVIKEVGING